MNSFLFINFFNNCLNFGFWRNLSELGFFGYCKIIKVKFSWRFGEGVVWLVLSFMLRKMNVDKLLFLFLCLIVFIVVIKFWYVVLVGGWRFVFCVWILVFDEVYVNSWIWIFGVVNWKYVLMFKIFFIDFWRGLLGLELMWWGLWSEKFVYGFEYEFLGMLVIIWNCCWVLLS